VIVLLTFAILPDSAARIGIACRLMGVIDGPATGEFSVCFGAVP
jgi:hypothetical protein